AGADVLDFDRLAELRRGLFADDLFAGDISGLRHGLLLLILGRIGNGGRGDGFGLRLLLSFGSVLISHDWLLPSFVRQMHKQGRNPVARAGSEGEKRSMPRARP